MSVNPYASPRSSLAEETRQECWRDGKELVMRVGTELPHRCVKCNEQAVTPIKPRKISWHHPGWYILVLLNIIVYAIVAAIASKRQTIAPGLCAEHIKKRRIAIAASWGGMLLGFALAFVGMTEDINSFPILGLVLVLVAAIVGIVGSRIVYPSRISKEEIRLNGCGEEFLQSL